jgi:hypothetical protein
MNDSKPKTPYRGVDRRAPRAATGAEAGAGDSYGGPLKRGAKIGGRHAAITTDLYSWHSYKTWADKMRGNWDDEK